jgi:hypothetical protein
LARHFLNRLRLRIKQRRSEKQRISLNREEIADLRLWLVFLAKAHTGISLNRITTRKPSRLGWSDSCPFGLGGFLLSGRAWRIRIPEASPIYGLDIENNVLEFLGMVITIWLVIYECDREGAVEECILALGDNTSAIGWLFKSGRLPTDSLYYEPVQFIARVLADIITQSSHCLASQHLKGDLNTVSDLLSFVGDIRGYEHPLAPDSPTDEILTRRFHSHLPQLIPEHFEILDLPSEISSFAIRALQIIESSSSPDRRKQTKKKTASGEGGPPSARTPDSVIDSSSITYPKASLSSSSEPFSPSTGSLSGLQQETFLASVRAPWFHRLCELPQAVWLRRFGVVSNGVPFTSREAPSYSPPSDPF